MHCIRISYHAKDRLPLITGPVRQCYEAVRASHPAAQISMRSGWFRGPHLDLCIASEAPVDCASELALMQAWIDENPSTELLIEAEYDALSRKLGALEGVSGPFTPLRPNNAVAIEEYRPPRLVDGHEVLYPVYERFFSAAAPLLFDLAEMKRTNPAASTLVLVGMLAHAADQLEPHGIERGQISLLAHADFFFANYDSSGRIRTHFDAMAERWSEALDLAVERRPEEAVGAEQSAAAARIMEGWRGVIADTKAEIEEVIRVDSSWFYYNPAAFEEELGDTHQAAFDDAGLSTDKIRRGATLDSMADTIDTEFFTSEAFQSFRVLLNLYYSLLPTLSISPTERFGMCHMVAETLRRARSAS